MNRQFGEALPVYLFAGDDPYPEGECFQGTFATIEEAKAYFQEHGTQYGWAEILVDQNGAPEKANVVWEYARADGWTVNPNIAKAGQHLEDLCPLAKP